MRQVCFDNSEFVNYVNENMVVVFGFNWSGRNVIIDGDKVNTTEAYTPYQPDKKVKNVLPFAKPLVTKKPSGKLKGKYYLKSIKDEILAAGIPATEYGILDASGRKLIDWKVIQQATANQVTAEIFLNFFRQANDQLAQQNDTQISGSVWRKGYWNVLQAKYYLKEKYIKKSVNMLVEVIETENVPEKYKKEAKALQKKMTGKIVSYIDGLKKKLKDKEKRVKYVEFMRIVYKYFDDYEDVTDKIKEVCKKNKISKKELLGE